jgi:hypothetical protein
LPETRILPTLLQNASVKLLHFSGFVAQTPWHDICWASGFLKHLPPDDATTCSPQIQNDQLEDIQRGAQTSRITDGMV